MSIINVTIANPLTTKIDDGNQNPTNDTGRTPVSSERKQRQKHKKCPDCGIRHNHKNGCYKRYPEKIPKRRFGTEHYPRRPNVMSQVYRQHVTRFKQYLYGGGFERQKKIAAALRADPMTIQSYVLAAVEKIRGTIDSNAQNRACEDAASHMLSMRTAASLFERKQSWVMWKRLFGLYPDDDRNYTWQQEQRTIPRLEWQQYRFSVTFEIESSFVAATTQDGLLLDYDLKDGCTIDSVVHTIRTCVKLAREQNMRLCFILFRTDRGIHVYEVSRPWHHRSFATLDIMSACGCDPLYCCMTEYRGFAARIFPKLATDDFVVRPGYMDIEINKLTSKQTMKSRVLNQEFHYRSLDRPNRSMKSGYVIGDIQAINRHQFALMDMRWIMVQYFRALASAGIPYHGDILRAAVDLHLDQVLRSFGKPSNDRWLIKKIRHDIDRLYQDCLWRHDA